MKNESRDIKESERKANPPDQIELQLRLLEETERLAEELTALSKIVERLRAQRYLQILDNPRRFLLYSFLNGVAGGLGRTIGATVVIAILAFILSKIQLVPIIGEWVSEIVAIVRENLQLK
jgi:hypothetical protein